MPRPVLTGRGTFWKNSYGSVNPDPSLFLQLLLLARSKSRPFHVAEGFLHHRDCFDGHHRRTVQNRLQDTISLLFGLGLATVLLGLGPSRLGGTSTYGNTRFRTPELARILIQNSEVESGRSPKVHNYLEEKGLMGTTAGTALI